MYVHVCVCVCVYLFVCVHNYLHVYTCMYMYVCVCVYLFVCVHNYLHVYTCMYALFQYLQRQVQDEVENIKGMNVSNIILYH